jgi:hypothetical protein
MRRIANRKEPARLSQSHHSSKQFCRCLGMSVLQQTYFGDGLLVDVNVFNMLLPGVCIIQSRGVVRCTSYTLSRGIEEQSP